MKQWTFVTIFISVLMISTGIYIWAQFTSHTVIVTVIEAIFGIGTIPTALALFQVVKFPPSMPSRSMKIIISVILSISLVTTVFIGCLALFQPKLERRHFIGKPAPITGIPERIPTSTPTLTIVTLTPTPSPTTVTLMPTSTPILTPASRPTSTPTPQKIVTPTSTPTKPPHITISGIWKEEIITNGPINNLSLTQVGNSVTGQGTEAYPGHNYNVTINGSIDGIKVNITEYIDSSCSEQYSLNLNNNGLSMSGNKSGCNGNLENVTFTKS